jgi:hypothetical protein
MDEKVKVLPFGKFDYSTHPITREVKSGSGETVEEYLNGVIEVTKEDLEKLGLREVMWSDDLKTLVETTDAERLTDAIYVAEKLNELIQWFNEFYDVQILQAQRAARLGGEFLARDAFGNRYTSLEELDLTASEFQDKIRQLRGAAETEKTENGGGD